MKPFEREIEKSLFFFKKKQKKTFLYWNHMVELSPLFTNTSFR